ncbi:MAG: hypothetical protein K6G30_06595, partial [Acetatifactor sp.]|nr:hypothetical protein [Acetatifactor sp.]
GLQIYQCYYYISKEKSKEKNQRKIVIFLLDFCKNEYYNVVVYYQVAFYSGKEVQDGKGN